MTLLKNQMTMLEERREGGEGKEGREEKKGSEGGREGAEGKEGRKVGLKEVGGSTKNKQISQTTMRRL